jgi:hypothetical protein
MTTFSSIDLDYRPVACGCCFAISLNGLVLCCSRNPVTDSARVLKAAGVTDDTIITMSPDGDGAVGIMYFLSSALSGMVPELTQDREQITQAA